MNSEALQRLKDLVEIPDMAPNLALLRKDIGALLAELERLKKP